MPPDARRARKATSVMRVKKLRAHKTPSLRSPPRSKNTSSHSSPIKKKAKVINTARPSSTSLPSLSRSPSPSPQWEYDPLRDGPILEPYEGPEDDDGFFDESIPVLRGVRQTPVKEAAATLQQAASPIVTESHRPVPKKPVRAKAKVPAENELHLSPRPLPSTRIPKLSQRLPKPVVIEHQPLPSVTMTQQLQTFVTEPPPALSSYHNSYSSYSSESESSDDGIYSSLFHHLIGVARQLEKEERDEGEEPQRKRGKREKRSYMDYEHYLYRHTSCY